MTPSTTATSASRASSVCKQALDDGRRHQPQVEVARALSAARARVVARVDVVGPDLERPHAQPSATQRRHQPHRDGRLPTPPATPATTNAVIQAGPGEQRETSCLDSPIHLACANDILEP